MADIRRGELLQLCLRQHGRLRPLDLLERERNFAALLCFRRGCALDTSGVVLLGEAFPRLLLFEILARAAQLGTGVIVAGRPVGRRLRAIRRRPGRRRQGQQHGEPQRALPAPCPAAPDLPAMLEFPCFSIGAIHHLQVPLLLLPLFHSCLACLAYDSYDCSCISSRHHRAP